MTSDHLQVFVTVGEKEEARNIAESVVEEELAACVQITAPVESVYTWEGSIQDSKEWLCLLKTTNVLYDELEERIKELHSYENPEIIALPIEKGSKEYLYWIDDVTR